MRCGDILTTRIEDRQSDSRARDSEEAQCSEKGIWNCSFVSQAKNGCHGVVSNIKISISYEADFLALDLVGED
jgi:hypothetical protein